MNTKLIAGLLLITIILLGNPVSARPNYMSAFMDEYNVTDTRLATCDMCHINPNGGGPRDSYGLAYAENGKDFLAIEELDSDGDGFSNIEEINALTFPGDSEDHPGVAEVIETTTVDTENSIESNSKTDVKTTSTERQSSGFQVVIALFAMIAAFYTKRV